MPLGKRCGKSNSDKNQNCEEKLFLRLQFLLNRLKIGHSLERNQNVGKLILRLDLAQIHDLLIHQITNVEIAAMDMAIPVVLDWICGQHDRRRAVDINIGRPFNRAMLVSSQRAAWIRRTQRSIAMSSDSVEE